MLTRSLDKAKSAFKDRNVNATIAAHSKNRADASEQHTQEQGKYIKSMVYGGLDGIITTFAVVAGVTGASLSSGIVLILGFANLIADGISMAIGDYLSTKAEIEYNRAERERERWEVEHYPEGERKEMIELYTAKGISREDAKTMVTILEKTPDAWVDIMMKEELGIVEEEESPVRNGIVTFVSFALFGVIPILAYVMARPVTFFRENTFVLASVLTGLTLFTLGAVKVRITGRNWILSGLETAVVGGVAAAAAFGIGYLLSGFAG